MGFGGITKVQSDFLKLGSSDPDLTLHLKQREAMIREEKKPSLEGLNEKTNEH